MSEDLQREINGGLTDLELAAVLMKEWLELDKWGEAIAGEWRWFNQELHAPIIWHQIRPNKITGDA